MKSFKSLALYSMIFCLVGFIGCGSIKIYTPYGAVNADTDTQIFVYTDTDVNINKDSIKSDDTTLIVMGITDSTEDISVIMINGMNKIKEIFETKSKVYKEWVKGRKDSE